MAYLRGNGGVSQVTDELMRTARLQTLPTEVMQDIAKRLDPFDLEDLCLVCTRMYRGCLDLLTKHRQRKRLFRNVHLGSVSREPLGNGTTYKNSLELLLKIHDEPIIAAYIRRLDMSAVRRSDMLGHELVPNEVMTRVPVDEPVVKPLLTLWDGLNWPPDQLALSTSPGLGTHAALLRDTKRPTYKELEKEATAILPFLCVDVEDLVCTDIWPRGSAWTGYVGDLMAPKDAGRSAGPAPDNKPLRKLRSVSICLEVDTRDNEPTSMMILSHFICAAPQTLKILRGSGLELKHRSSEDNFGFWRSKVAAEVAVTDLQLYRCHMRPWLVVEYIEKFLPRLESLHYSHDEFLDHHRETWSAKTLCRGLVSAAGERLRELTLVAHGDAFAYGDKMTTPITTFNGFTVLNALRVYTPWLADGALLVLPASLKFLGLQTRSRNGGSHSELRRMKLELNRPFGGSCAPVTQLERLVFNAARDYYLGGMRAGMQYLHPGIAVVVHPTLEFDWWTGPGPRYRNRGPYEI